MKSSIRQSHILKKGSNLEFDVREDGTPFSLNFDDVYFRRRMAWLRQSMSFCEEMAAAGLGAERGFYYY